MGLRLAFTGGFGGGSTAVASETGAQGCAATVSEFSGSGSKLAVPKERDPKARTRPLWTWRSVAIAGLASLLGHLALAQTGSPVSARAIALDRLTIVNPQHQEVPEERARVLLLTTSRVVAEEFHRHPNEVDLKLTLIIGEKDERSMMDIGGHLTLYMDHWNEGKFVDGVITGAVQQLTTMQTRKKMFKDIVRRSDEIAPVSANRLRGESFNRTAPVLDLVPDCFSAVAQVACPWSRWTPSHTK